MIGILQAYATPYLVIAGVANLAAYGIPLLVAPMAWARLFRWRIPPPAQLTTFLGRSLGAFVCIISVFAFRVAALPAAQPFFFQLMLLMFLGMIGLHAYGAIRKEQPTTETLETGLWVILLLATLAFYPAG